MNLTYVLIVIVADVIIVIVADEMGSIMQQQHAPKHTRHVISGQCVSSSLNLVYATYVLIVIVADVIIVIVADEMGSIMKIQCDE